ncbi:MAG: cobalamin-dependent protein [Bacillota bacterium]
MRKKILLITPPYHAGVVEAAGKWPHLGFIYVAGHVRHAGFEVEIYDAMTKDHTLEQIKERIASSKPDWIGTTAYTSSINEAVRVLIAAKEIDPRIITCIGGIHANFCYEELLTRYSGTIDYVVRGEGEETMPELIRAVADGADPAGVKGVAFVCNGKVIVTPPRPFVPDMDALIPAWDLVDWEDYTFYVMPGSRLGLVNSSRGCINDCSFCSQQKFWLKQYRERSARSFVQELEYLRDNFGVNVVMLSDEYPTRSRRRWEHILELLIDRQVGVNLLLETCVEDILRDADIMDKYREAGVLHIYVGVEATNQDKLDQFKKNIKCEHSREAIRLINGAGMLSECSFVLGMPDETPETIEQTLQLARYYDPDFAHFLMIAPWPYADVYDELKDHIVEKDYSKYNFVEPVVKPDGMTVQELSQAIFRCYKEYYISKLTDYERNVDPFKREYLLRSMEVMMNNSFLTKNINKLGKMPEQVKRFLEKHGLGC